MTDFSGCNPMAKSICTEGEKEIWKMTLEGIDNSYEATITKAELGDKKNNLKRTLHLNVEL